MRNWVPLLFILPALTTGMACNRAPVNTLPDPARPTDAVKYYDLEVPADLEIKAVDFAATTFAEVSGTEMVTSVASGRAFVKVYAVKRATGEQFLLLYEDIAHRRQPVQVIRFVRGGAP